MVSMFILSASIFMLACFVLFGAAFLKRYLLTRDEFEQKKRAAEAEAAEILEQSRRDTEQAIFAARSRAKKSLEDFETLVQTADAGLEKALRALTARQEASLEKASRELLATEQSLLEASSKKHESAMQTVSKHAAEALERSLASFEQFVKTEMTRYREDLSQRIVAEEETVRKDLEKYRVDSEQSIKESVLRVIADASKHVLGKVLSLEDHQALVTKALEEAKKAGFFAHE